MKRLLLPILAALALPTAVNAGMRFERIETGYCSTSQKKAPKGSDCFKFTETNDEAIRRLSREIGEKLAVGILELATAVKVLVQNFRELLDVIALLMIAFGGLTAKIVGTGIVLNNLFKRFKDFFGEENEIKLTLPDGRDIAKTFIPLKKELEVVDGFIYTTSNELSIRIPNATEKAIAKFKELNNGVLEDIKKKKENIRMIIAEGINSGITKMSEALSRSLVFGEKLSDTLRNMALNVLAKIVSILIEQIARQSIQIAMENTHIGQLITKLSIEKQITDEKRRQQSAMAGGSDNMGSSLVRMATSFFVCNLFFNT